MSIIFSRQCEYALQAVLYLALKSEGKKTSINELTKHLELPYHFTAKILQTLSQQGVLTSQKGATGGFSIAKPAKDITLFHVIEAIDGIGFMNNCVLGFPECDGVHPCSMHDSWAKIRDELYSSLASKNITEMALDMRKPQYRKN